MTHSTLTLNHAIENWTYANASARLSASSFLPADVGKIAYQTDTGQYWRLVDDSPITWAILVRSYAQTFIPANPTLTTSTAGAHMGLGSTIAYTPIKTGNVVFTLSGTISNSLASDGARIILRYGTGTAPTNGTTTIVGTSAGNTVRIVNNASTAALQVPFSMTVSATGLTIGTPYWFDAVLLAITAGNAAISDITGVVMEI